MKMFKNKKGIELSVNFIVMLVLAITVFIGGLAFAAKFFSHAETVRGSLDSETERQIERLLDSGSPVVLPISTGEIFRKKHDTFGIGVFAMNEGDYSIETVFKNGYDKQKRPLTNKLDVIVEPKTGMNIKKNKKGKFLVLVKADKDIASGTYIIEFQARYNGCTNCGPDGTKILQGKYDDPVQLIIKVP